MYMLCTKTLWLYNNILTSLTEFFIIYRLWMVWQLKKIIYYKYGIDTLLQKQIDTYSFDIFRHWSFESELSCIWNTITISVRFFCRRAYLGFTTSWFATYYYDINAIIYEQFFFLRYCCSRVNDQIITICYKVYFFLFIKLNSYTYYVEYDLTMFLSQVIDALQNSKNHNMFICN